MLCIAWAAMLYSNIVRFLRRKKCLDKAPTREAFAYMAGGSVCLCDAKVEIRTTRFSDRSEALL